MLNKSASEDSNHLSPFPRLQLHPAYKEARFIFTQTSKTVTSQQEGPGFEPQEGQFRRTSCIFFAKFCYKKKIPCSQVHCIDYKVLSGCVRKAIVKTYANPIVIWIIFPQLAKFQSCPAEALDYFDISIWLIFRIYFLFIKFFKYFFFAELQMYMIYQNMV